METHLFRQTFKASHVRTVFLGSDFHLDAPDTDIALIKTDLARAQAHHADIFLNGDIFSLLIPSDRKRYAKSTDTMPERDDMINVAVQRAVDLLAPYVNLIRMIGIGNHEKEILKRHNVDVTAFLIDKLNALRLPSTPAIRHGGYTGFIRFLYEHESGGNVRKCDVFYNHGQGGSSEITKGMIDLSRYAGHINADVLWLGHKHTRGLWMLDPLMGFTPGNKVVCRQRYGVITGCYSKQLKEYDIVKKGYQIDYGEEKMRVPVARRGVLMSHTLSAHTLRIEFVL